MWSEYTSVMVTKHIPNFITLCNLGCGCIGIVYSFQGNLKLGAMLIWLGALFDFLDGLAARVLRKYSEVGKDLDSLADLITFCFLPATILYVLTGSSTENSILPLTGYLLVIFGALRLAKFNNDARQTDTFYGLPVPASALFVSALPFAATAEPDVAGAFFMKPVTLVLIAAILSVLMVSDIRLISLKFRNLNLRENLPRYVLLLIALMLLLFFKILALPMIILVYVVLSIALKNYK